MKLWGSRFSKETDDLVNDFNSSISFDKRLYKEDINGSIAHVSMLAKCNIISMEESKKIKNCLIDILNDFENGKIEFSKDAEDIHMNVETILTERLGDVGKKLHTARSRNDQVALDTKLYFKSEVINIIEILKEFIAVLIEKAEENKETIMPGYTHLQRAQPTTFAHYMMAYANMFKRDILRLENALEIADECPIGSGAFAGVTYDIDRQLTAKMLGFKKPTDNSMDSVSDRDFVAHGLFCLSMVMMHLSRLCEEIILWCSWEFKFVELDDAFSTGSSIMPQKKNPDVAELARGKAGRVYGDLMCVMSMLKNLPMAYNKDMQEDKEALFDGFDNTILSLKTVNGMVKTMSVYKENMLMAAKKGFINATDLADYLTKKGVPFRDSYKVSGAIVKYANEKGKVLDELTLDEFKSFCDIFGEDIYNAIDLETCVNIRKSYGGPAKESIEKQIDIMKKFINK